MGLVGCKSGKPTSTMDSTTPSTRTTTTTQEPDSLLFTPAGAVTYAGNLNSRNLVPTVTLNFPICDNNLISINYRADIDTPAGKARNEIVTIHDNTGEIRYNGIGPTSYAGDITLTVAGLPAGITSKPQTAGFAFNVANDMKPGRYDFQIDANINGNVYILPGSITVR
jgi:hypothetical protein